MWLRNIKSGNNYQIEIDHKKKNYHINMLKPYFERGKDEEYKPRATGGHQRSGPVVDKDRAKVFDTG